MRKVFLLSGCLLCLARLQFGQEPIAGQPLSASNNAVSEGLLSRWLDINTFSASLRYRSTENSGGFHTFDFGQHRELLEGRFKFDKEGKYSLNFHGSSGRYFNWAYADAIDGQFTDGVPHAGKYRPFTETLLIIQALKADPTSPYPTGIASRGAYFYFRQFYLSASPIKHVAFQYGGLGIEHGENTEATSFDDDGYISGARVRLTDPDHVFFNEIDGTWANLAHALTPNFFARGDDLGQVNYQQYMVRKKFGRFSASADFTSLRKSSTMREAVKIKVPELHIIDTARLELYQRTNLVSYYGLKYAAGSGFAFTGSKTIDKRLTLEGGYDHIDKYYGVYTGDPFLIAVGFSWNGDSFMVGSKAFARGKLKVAPGVSLFGFFSHEVSPYDFFITNHATAEGGITFDMADLMHRGHLL